MAMDLFAKIGEIKGESQDSKHPEEIEVMSWAWGLANDPAPPHGGGGGAGRATFAAFTFTHRLDKASPQLMTACATGQHIAQATVTARKSGPGQMDFLNIKMSDVVIVSVTPSGAREDTGNIEVVSLRFRKVDLEYKAQRPDGSLDPGTHFTFDLQTHREG